VSPSWRLALVAVALLWGIGALLVLLFNTVGVLIFAALCVVLVVLSRVLVVRRFPARSRSQMLALVNPDAGPPPEAEPAQSELLNRFHAAGEAQDWHAVRQLLAAEFVFVDPAGRRHDANSYLRSQKLLRRVYPDLEGTTEAVVAVPQERGVLYFRSTVRGHPRSGPAFDGTAWSRLTTTADGDRVREITHVGVIRVG
jgi:hypothetical protein